jgi:hypothetical protein
MGTADSPPDRVLSYARLVTDRVGSVCAGRLQAAYLHGSSALGGWLPGRSDADILALAEDVTGPVQDRVAWVPLAAGQQCPGRDLECSLVSGRQARNPGPPWPFQLHVQAGPGGARH